MQAALQAQLNTLGGRLWCFSMNHTSLCELGHHARVWNPRKTTSGEKGTRPERDQEKIHFFLSVTMSNALGRAAQPT